MMAPTRAVTAEDLLDALDKLILPSRVRITREITKKQEWCTVPPLWAELQRSAGWTGSNSGGGAFGSRPVISAGAVDLIIEIGTAVAERAEEIGRSMWLKQGLRRSAKRHDTIAELRAIAAGFVSNNTDPDLISWWVESINDWANKIRGILGMNPQLPRNLRKTTCPNCMASVVQVRDDAGEEVRSWPLTVTWTCPPGEQHNPDTDWTVRAIECLACGHAWFRGSDLEELVSQIIADNQTRETMTDIA